MEPFAEGARLEVRSPEPAIDLAALAACLAAAVPVPSLPVAFLPVSPRSPAAPPPKASPGAGPSRKRLLRWDDGSGVLTIDTPAVLSRLGRSPALKTLKPGPGPGFLRHAPVPRAR